MLQFNIDFPCLEKFVTQYQLFCRLSVIWEREIHKALTGYLQSVMSRYELDGFGMHHKLQNRHSLF